MIYYQFSNIQMITKINKIPKREMTLGPKAAQLTWTSGHSSPCGQARSDTGRARVGASGPDASTTSQPSTARQTGPAKASRPGSERPSAHSVRGLPPN